MTELTTESENRQIPFKKIIISIFVVIVTIFVAIAVLSNLYPV